MEVPIRSVALSTAVFGMGRAAGRTHPRQPPGGLRPESADSATHGQPHHLRVVVRVPVMEITMLADAA